MNKVILSLIALISVVSLSSCKNEPAPPKEISPARIHLLSADDVRSKIGDITVAPWKFLNDKPVIIDFYADWCGPCKQLEPHLWEVAHQYYGKIEIFRVDTEDNKEFAAQWEIEYLPSLYFIPKNGAPKLYTGYKNTTALRALVEKELIN